MSDVFDEAVRRTHLRFPGTYWEILSPQQRADAIWEEIHRIDRTGELRRVAPPPQVDSNVEHPTNRIIARRRRKAA